MEKKLEISMWVKLNVSKSFQKVSAIAFHDRLSHTFDVMMGDISYNMSIRKFADIDSPMRIHHWALNGPVCLLHSGSAVRILKLCTTYCLSCTIPGIILHM